MASNLKVKTVILDSNIWIASITKSDCFHYESLRLIAYYTARRVTILIPIIVIIEIIAFISRNSFPANFKNTYLQYLQNTENYKIIGITNEESIEYAKKLPPKVGLRAFDYYIVLYCQKYKPDRLETFDNELKIAYNKFVNI